jgi:hypothetical protein
LPNEKISSVLEIILGNTLFIAKDKDSIAILDNSSMIWTICWLVEVSNWSRSNSSIHTDNKSMEAKQYSMQLEMGAQLEPFDKSRSMHTQYVGLYQCLLYPK